MTLYILGDATGPPLSLGYSTPPWLDPHARFVRHLFLIRFTLPVLALKI